MVRSLLRESLEGVPIVDKGGYQYFVHPITDGASAIEPLLLEEVVLEFQKEAAFDCDKIVTIEAMGIPIATLLSHKTRKPFVIVRKRSYGLPGELSIEAATGYSRNKLFVNGLKKGDRVIIVDDVLSTGGTLVAVVKALKSIGVVVEDIHVVFNKHPHKEQLEAEMGQRIHVLMNVTVANGRMVEFEP